MKYQNLADALPFLETVKKAISEQFPEAEFEANTAGTHVTVKNPDNGKTQAIMSHGGDYGSNWVAELHDVPVILRHLHDQSAEDATEKDGGVIDEDTNAPSEAEGGGSEPEMTEEETVEGVGEPALGPQDAGTERDVAEQQRKASEPQSEPDPDAPSGKKVNVFNKIKGAK